MEHISESIIKALLHAGVKRCYTVPCDLVWLLKSIEDTPQLQLVSVRHESSATFMADADARLSGVPAVVVVGRSVGATNASNGIHTALTASTPMLVLVNDVDTNYAAFDAFQKMDLQTFFGPVCKRYFAATRSDSLPELVSEALRVATSGMPGPVVISIPTDLAGQVEPWTPRLGTGYAPPVQPDATSVREFADRLAAAKRSVIIAGGGTRAQRARLIRFAEKYQAGVYTTFRRQDVFPNDHPQYLGHLGMYAPPATLVALREADVVCVLGSKLNQMTTQRFTLPLPSTEMLRIDIDPARIQQFRPATASLAAPMGGALSALIECTAAVAARDWSAAHERYVASAAIGADRGVDGVDPAQVIRAMQQALPDDTVMCSEAGGYATFLHQHWMFRHPDTQAAPTTGTMGYAVPAAVAAKLAQPLRCVVALVGDGGFLMNGQEIETAVRMRIPLIVVVFNNRLLSGGGYLQNREYARITDVDYAAYARAFGAQGLTVRHTAELEPAFAAARAANEVVVIDVKTDPDVATPGHAVRTSPT